MHMWRICEMSMCFVLSLGLVVTIGKTWSLLVAAPLAPLSPPQTHGAWPVAMRTWSSMPLRQRMKNLRSSTKWVENRLEGRLPELKICHWLSPLEIIFIMIIDMHVSTLCHGPTRLRTCGQIWVKQNHECLRKFVSNNFCEKGPSLKEEKDLHYLWTLTVAWIS